MDSLDLKYAKSILLRLAGTEKVKKSDLFDIVKSHQVLDNLLDALSKDGYITIEENERGPKKYSISLTSKGIAVIKPLQKADDISHDKIAESRFLTDEQEMLLFLLGKPEHDMDSLVNKFPGAYGAVKYLAGFGLVSQKLAGEGTASVNRIYLTEKGKRVGQSLRRVKLELER